MALVSSALPNLVGGISQQPAALRLPNACRDMVNAWPSVVNGNQKRPPTQHVAKVDLTLTGAVASYLIERDPTYRYMVIVTNGDLKVLNLNNGTLQTVAFPNGKAYLNASNPVDSFRFVTIGDYTFIANNNIPVQASQQLEGASSFIPDGTVATFSALPSAAPLGTTYKVTNTGKFYKYVYVRSKAAVYDWNVDYTGYSPSSLSGYTQVTSLYTPTTTGEKIYTVFENTYGSGENAGTITGYTLYTSYVKTAGIAAHYEWQELTAADYGRFDPATRGYVYVTQSQYNSYYSVYINNVLKASYLSPSGASGSSACPDTATIAATLESQLNSNGYTTSRVGSLIAITNLTAADKVVCQAGSGDKSARGFKDRVSSFSDLPYQAPEGTILCIAGDPKENTDDYFVVYSNGVWKETYGWQAKEALVVSTMPQVLVREIDGSWTFKNHTWKSREVGDSETNQTPSFVGSYVNDLFTYSNRLGMLADENIILSETDQYENFYRTTVAQILDSDRIDVAVLYNQVQTLRHAVPYNRDLLISSETAQFRLTYQNFLGPKNIQVKFTTAFSMSKRIKPVSMGNSVYFVDDRSDYNFMKVWEYFPKDLAVSDDADDVTAQVPEYIPYDCTFFLGSNRAKAAVLSTASNPNSLYFYKFFWAGDKKVQTAWHKWTFNDCVKIHSGAFSGTYLYILVQRSDGLNLERIKFDEDVFDLNTNYEILLDRRSTSVTKTYDATTKVTTITLPWSTTANVEVIGSDPVGTVDPVNGVRYDVTKVNSNTVTVDGDITSQNLTVGLSYEWKYEFSTFFFKQQKGSGDVVVLDGRVQLRYVTVEYHNSAYFQTHVLLPGRDEFVTTFNGRVAGDFQNVLGTQSFASGKYRIPVMGRNDEVRCWLTNDSPYPHAFGSAEWQGIISPKSVQRV